MTIELNEPYVEKIIKQIGVENLKEEILKFLKRKFKDDIIEYQIKNSPKNRKKEAQKFLKICESVSNRVKSKDINELKELYFKEKGYL